MAEQQRVAIVTGSTGGLGPAVVEALRGADWAVVGLARHGDEAVDLTNEEQVQAVISRVASQHGRIDALLNVAGGFAGGQPVHETSSSTWQHMLALNLTATFLCCKAVLPHMLQADYGRIVNVASRNAVQPAATLSAYNVSKAGVVTLTETIAAEMRGHNITCNAVLPSVIDTPSNRQAMPNANVTTWVRPAAIAAVMLDVISDRWGIVSGAAIPVYGQV